MINKILYYIYKFSSKNQVISIYDICSYDKDPYNYINKIQNRKYISDGNINNINFYLLDIAIYRSIY